MAIERLKFRCYQCNQLLASSPAKAGSIVSCPRCKADLVVPAPDSAGEADPEASAVGKAAGRAESALTSAKRAPSGGPDDLAAAMPADLIDLRPEDLRVEAEFFESLTRTPQPPRERELAPPWSSAQPQAPFAIIETGFPNASSSSRPAIESAADQFQPTAGRPEFPSAFPAVAAHQPWLAPASPVVPPIEIDAPSLLPPDREFRPVHEVVLPASAVVAWSLFGLIGIATSFLAGLMVGHYFWRM